VDINTLIERCIVTADSFVWSGNDWSADGSYALTSEWYYWMLEGSEEHSDFKEIISLQLATGKRVQLTDNELMDFEARLSPDESKIVYISGLHTQGYQIMLMNSDGSNNTTIVDTLALYNTIRWSPAGDKIAYNKSDKLAGYAKYEPGSDIFVHDMISGETKQITNFAVDSIPITVQDWK